MSSSNKFLAEEYWGRINRVMDHIDRNLEKSFTLEEMAAEANFSKFHFNRIFWAMTGETPFEFLNRLRMEKAASLLVMNPKETISEISYLCGFSSLPVFSRNFKVFFGVSPSEWRSAHLAGDHSLSNSGQTNSNINQSSSNKDQEDSSSTGYFSQHVEPLKWKTNMELNKSVEVKDFPKTTVAYVRHTGPYAGNEKLFEQLYGDLFAWAGPRNLANSPGLKCFNIYHDDPSVTDENNLRLSVGLSVPEDTKVEGKVGKLKLDAGKYVVANFELTSQDYEKAWGWLFGEWFPSSGYQPADGPCFELCAASMQDPIHKVDICVPVKPM